MYYFVLGGGGKVCGMANVSPPACRYNCIDGSPVCVGDDEEDSADYDYDEDEGEDYSASADQYYAEE